ncbi:transcription repressor NadR [Bacillus canaveralius]|uniref:Transcription repressor NadR n=1 Tax=Bacillus canaveralius TaxID=1403243 RepID=A0A2N5GFG6_9BACI|nr:MULTISPECIES: transcription repressor NadR [Bacillus]PLR79492.1 transcription repressor NadR [Bacillus canaveralius]PLR83908.1 transcription repressor NadR [Bacillus sp. V33-4]PLR88804.1 transcription repressor NadR [Bacillus canaveralius]RSK44874.1 transcription repressor NadR [Bacillus canaveralius]
MKDQMKVLGDERRELLLQLLKESEKPLTGSELAARTNVSRQVIVSDITLLKVRKEPIIATSQGYIYLRPVSQTPVFERTVACFHPPERTEDELNLLVDLGVTVKDVKIEHPVYGDLTASIMVSNRTEVQRFMRKIHETKAAFLSELTAGIHLHTISARSEQTLIEAESALKQANFLVSS